MTDKETPKKPNVINLVDRTPFAARPNERLPPATDGVDKATFTILNAITDGVRCGETVGVLGMTMDPKNGEPIAFIQFPPDSLPRQAALQYIGLLETLRAELIDIAKFGDTPEPVLEDEEDE